MSTIIRRFRWEDPFKGWGDAGTEGFYVLDKTFSTKRAGFGKTHPAHKYFYEHVKPYDMAYGLEVIDVNKLIRERTDLSKKIKLLELQMEQVDNILKKI